MNYEFYLYNDNYKIEIISNMFKLYKGKSLLFKGKKKLLTINTIFLKTILNSESLKKVEVGYFIVCYIEICGAEEGNGYFKIKTSEIKFDDLRILNEISDFEIIDEFEYDFKYYYDKQLLQNDIGNQDDFLTQFATSDIVPLFLCYQKDDIKIIADSKYFITHQLSYLINTKRKFLTFWCKYICASLIISVLNIFVLSIEFSFLIRFFLLIICLLILDRIKYLFMKKAQELYFESPFFKKSYIFRLELLFELINLLNYFYYLFLLQVAPFNYLLIYELSLFYYFCFKFFMNAELMWFSGIKKENIYQEIQESEKIHKIKNIVIIFWNSLLYILLPLIIFLKMLYK